MPLETMIIASLSVWLFCISIYFHYYSTQLAEGQFLSGVYAPITAVKTA